MAGAAAGAGLGGASSFALGTIASIGASSLAQGLVKTAMGSDASAGSDGIQALISGETNTVNQIGSMPDYGSPKCRAGVEVGFAMGIAGIILLDVSAHVIGSSNNSRVYGAGLALLGVGMVLPVAGLLYANSQCSG